MVISLTADRDCQYSPEVKAAIADEKCMICERLFDQHSQQQFEECMDEIVKRARTNL
jgi:hypothetical protein